jgi:hypothetical protein
MIINQIINKIKIPKFWYIDEIKKRVPKLPFRNPPEVLQY